MTDRVIAVYELAGPAAEAEKAAAMIAFEETVEVPLDFPLAPHVRANIVGRVESLAAAGPRFRAEISYPAALASHLGALLNLVFGNASIWRDVRLLDLRLPDSLLAGLGGPRLGVAGLRERLGVPKRALLATALKPMGSTDAELAAAAAAFARGGGDIVKDDQNIVDRDFGAFRRRVSRIGEAVAAENARSRRTCLYLPHLAGPSEELEERLRFVLGEGLAGVLICPAIVGLDRLRAMAAGRKAVFMAHPAYSGAFYADGSHGIEPSLYLGTFMRLAGADITVFPNAGGRFGFTREQCRAIAERGRAPLGSLAPLWPAPGGGMSLENAETMASDFGADSVWLVGGRLLMHEGGPEAGAAAFRRAIDKAFGG